MPRRRDVGDWPRSGRGRVHDPHGDSDVQEGAAAEPRELTFVDEATFWVTFGRSPTDAGNGDGSKKLASMREGPDGRRRP